MLKPVFDFNVGQPTIRLLLSLATRGTRPFAAIANLLGEPPIRVDRRCFAAFCGAMQAMVTRHNG